MTRVICIVERLSQPGRSIFDVFEWTQCADGWEVSFDIGEFTDRDTALALARYCAELDADVVLHCAEVVDLSKRRRTG
jgi:hypothetical protein